MQDILLFALLGLGSGALIAGIAVAIVLMYRGSGIINLATGGIAMLSGYCFWSLKEGEIASMGTAPALILTLIFTLLVGVAMELVAFRPLRNAAPLAKLVASLGILLIAQASMLLAFGSTQKPQPSILPSDVVTVFDVNVPVDRFILVGIIVAITVALILLYRFTRFGLATRAASENEVSALLAGLSATRSASTGSR
jgi:branched-chain amino acid transport system permease protein